MKYPVLLPSLLLLAACASTGEPRENERLAQVQAHAGESVRSASRLTSDRISSYETLGDRHLLLWEGSSRAWLLEVDGGCWNLESSFQVAFVHRTPWLETMTSHVVVGDRRCMVTDIRKVDAKALRTARKAQRETDAEG